MNALEDGFECNTCGDEITNIVDLIHDSCDDCLPASALSSSERSTLLYIESRVVDNDAMLDPVHMNYEDENNMKLFAAAGLLDVERTADLWPVNEFDAWELAWQCRRQRSSLG